LKTRLTQAGLRLLDRLLPQLIRLESSLAAGMIPLTVQPRSVAMTSAQRFLEELDSSQSIFSAKRMRIWLAGTPTFSTGRETSVIHGSLALSAYILAGFDP